MAEKSRAGLYVAVLQSGSLALVDKRIDVVAHPKAADYEYDACDTNQCDFLAKHQIGYHKSEDTLEIHVVVGLQRTYIAHRKRPQEISRGGSAKSEKQQVAYNLPAPDNGAKVGGPRLESQERQGCQQTVEKCLTGNEPHIVACAYLAENQRIHRPAESCGKRKKIAKRIDLEVCGTVEHHTHHTHHRQHAAYPCADAESLVLVEQTKHYGGDKRRHRREQRNIGGQRVLQRSVLGNKIERTAGEAAKHHEKFVGERGGEQALVADAQHHEIGQQEAEHINLHRPQFIDKQFSRGNERISPHGHGRKGREMAGYGGAWLADAGFDAFHG